MIAFQSQHKALSGALFVFAVIACFLSWPQPVARATGIGLQPANVELVVRPGTSVRRTIKLANLRTDKTQRFIVGVADWSLDNNGQLKLLPPSTESAGNWVRFAPASFTLKPAEAQEIVVDIAIPAKLPEAREYHMAILVTNPTPTAEEMKKLNGIWNQVQVASLFYLTPPGAKPKPVIEAVAFDGDATNGPFVRTLARNDGSAHARLIAQYKFLDESGKTIIEADTPTVLLQGQKRDWRAKLNAETLPAGTYQISWKLYTVFDPDRPNERVGELLQEQKWSWTKKPAAPAKPAASTKPQK